MDTNEEKIKDFLAQIPDRLIFSEHGRRMGNRNINRGRKKVLRQCRFCEAFFGAAEMRLHVAEVHPGGKKKNEVRKNTNPEVPRPCPKCGEQFGARKLVVHMREVHATNLKTVRG